MVERFNGRIEGALQRHHFRSGEERDATLYRYVWLYNQQLAQSALGRKTPLQAMKDRHKHKRLRSDHTTARDVTPRVRLNGFHKRKNLIHATALNCLNPLLSP